MVLLHIIYDVGSYIHRSCFSGACGVLCVWVDAAGCCALLLCVLYECCKPTPSVGLQHSYSMHRNSAQQQAVFTHTYNALHKILFNMYGTETDTFLP